MEQVDCAARLLPGLADRRFDVTYMGIGEPLANMTEVCASFALLMQKHAGLQKLNVSTVGLPDAIDRLAQAGAPGRLHLQFSLHSPFDDERRAIFGWDVPDLSKSIASVLAFGKSMGDVPCINYLLFDGVNDSRRHARALLELVPTDRCYVKVSTYGQVEGADLRPSSATSRERFLFTLRQGGLRAKTFRSRGQDVRAGCGQFVAEVL